jgi:signal transduction histidine kinase
MTRLYLIFFLFFSTTLAAHDTSYQLKVQKIVALLDSADTYSNKDFSRALTFAQTALAQANALNSDHCKLKALSAIGQIYEKRVRYDEAATYFKTAFELAQTHTDDSLKINAALEWAAICTQTYQFDTALAVYRTTLEQAEKIKNTYFIAWIYNDLGLLYDKTGQSEKSIEASLTSVSASESIGDNEQAAISLGNTIKIYIVLGNYPLALETIERLHKIANASKMPYRMASALNVHGSILSGLKRYDEALLKHTAALEMYEKLNDKRYLIRSLNYLQGVYLKQKNYAKAEASMNRCWSYRDYFDDQDRASFYSVQGNIYRETNREDDAIKAFEQAIFMAEKNKMVGILQGSHRRLAEIYQRKQLTDKAYTHLLAATVFSDSIIANERREHLALAQFKNNLERSEREIDVLKTQKTRNWVVAVCVLLLISVVGLSVISIIKRKAHKDLVRQKVEIERQNERLETTNETLRQFAYASAHDLKEPLRSISSFIKIIERRYISQLPTEASEYMGFVTGGVKRMENLLSALLEYATLASDEPIVVTEATALTDVLSDVSVLLSGVISEKKAEITQSGILPALFVNRVHLTQIVQNLLSNAMKFSTSTPVISLHGEVKNEQFLLTLKDNGIGIKKEYSNKIFRLFQRLNKTSQYEGTGIGLAICKQIVEKYGGRIWFESEEDKGTTFFIALPLSLVHNVPLQVVKSRRIAAFLS